MRGSLCIIFSGDFDITMPSRKGVYPKDDTNIFKRTCPALKLGVYQLGVYQLLYIAYANSEGSDKSALCADLSEPSLLANWICTSFNISFSFYDLISLPSNKNNKIKMKKKCYRTGAEGIYSHGMHIWDGNCTCSISMHCKK